jgi:GGDEF domain-containing protein
VFDATLERSLTRPAHSGTALVLVDVDSFTSINDTYATRSATTSWCTWPASCAATCGRTTPCCPGPAVTSSPSCCRAPRPTWPRRAEELLQGVRSTPLRRPDGTLLPLSVSFGVVHVAAGSADLRGLHSTADGALDEVKRAGRGRVGVAAV